MRVVPCPQCGSEVAWTSTPTRPFCSERCRLIDLGAWLDEKYTIPSPLTDESASEDTDAPPAVKRKDDGQHS